VDVPNYSTIEIMKEKFRTAILTCGEIDDDGNYYGSEDGQGENESGESDNSSLSDRDRSSDGGRGEDEGESESSEVERR